MFDTRIGSHVYSLLLLKPRYNYFLLIQNFHTIATVCITQYPGIYFRHLILPNVRR